LPPAGPKRSPDATGKTRLDDDGRSHHTAAAEESGDTGRPAGQIHSVPGTQFLSSNFFSPPSWCGGRLSPDLAIAASCIGPEEQARHVPRLIFAFPLVYLCSEIPRAIIERKEAFFPSQAAAKEKIE
jgi:hypothetical protein